MEGHRLFKLVFIFIYLFTYFSQEKNNAFLRDWNILMPLFLKRFDRSDRSKYIHI